MIIKFVNSDFDKAGISFEEKEVGFRYIIISLKLALDI